MRAIVTEDFGSTPIEADLPAPDAGPGEIRIKVRASSLNGFDLAMARGYLRGLMDHRFPAILGRDVAGTVDQTGDGVTAFAPGDEVFGVILTQPLHHGGFCEYVVVPAGHSITRIPPGIDHLRAGALGLAGSAAVAALAALRLTAGDLILISGATGGVGAMAIQLAAASEATVIATAASAAETEHVRRLGAAHVVDHTGDLLTQVRDIALADVEAVLHLAGDPAALAGLLTPGGRFASLLNVVPDPMPGRSITATSVIADPRPAVLDRLAADVAAGRLTIPVQRTYSLDGVPKAFEDFAAGTLGKLAVTI